ncbi:MAG: hypothetical protein K2M78_09720 [Lachnospiraceae bacterium]|nr:hypothetical protein [Lachnospiraceae bacterium]
MGNSIDTCLKTMLESIGKSFLIRDKSQFIINFDIDIISKYYIERLFENYTFYKIKECSYKIIKYNTVKEINLMVHYFLSYESDKKEILQFEIEVQKNKDGKCIIIEAKIINIYKAFNLKKQELSKEQIEQLLSYNKENISFNDMVELAKKSKDPLTHKIYERALNKSIRYRLTHPEIESAIILSAIMSKRTIALAKRINDENQQLVMKKINTVFNSIFIHKSYKEIRNKDKSTFPARELSLEAVSANIDELFFEYEMQRGKKVDIRCSEIAHLYAAIFRLTGFKFKESILLMLPFHYMNYIEIDDKFYIIDVNHIVEMNSERIYGGYNTLSGCATAEYYIDQFGNTNMEKELYESILNKMHNKLPSMQLLHKPKFKNYIPMEEIEFKGLNLDNELETQTYIYNKIFELSGKYPLSAYTWAKYCYHTIFVTYPQTYVSYSLSRNECIEFARTIKSKEELFGWMFTTLSEESIYSASDQIMTADQILKYKCGRKFDRAIFIYTILLLGKFIEEGSIIFTYENAYVQFIIDKEYYLYDAASLTQKDNTDGKLLIKFNEDNSLCEWN